MKRVIQSIAIVVLGLLISSCGSSTPKGDITTSNYKEIINESFKAVGLVAVVDNTQESLLDLIEEDEEEDARLLRLLSENKNISCQDGGTISIALEENSNNTKKYLIEAKECSEDGEYMDGNVALSISQENIDENKTQKEYYFSFNNFQHQNGTLRAFLRDTNITVVTMTNKNGSTTLTYPLHYNIVLNGSLENSKMAATFSNFTLQYYLKDKYYLSSLNGMITFKESQQEVKVVTDKKLVLEDDLSFIPIDGIMRIIGRDSFIKLIFLEDKTVEVYYNGTQKVLHDKSKNLIKLY